MLLTDDAVVVGFAYPRPLGARRPGADRAGREGQVARETSNPPPPNKRQTRSPGTAKERYDLGTGRVALLHRRPWQDRQHSGSSGGDDVEEPT